MCLCNCIPNAMQMQCNCIPIKSDDCYNYKKGFPCNPYIALVAHYKKRSWERHETKNKRFANFLAFRKMEENCTLKKGVSGNNPIINTIQEAKINARFFWISIIIWYLC